MNPWDGSPYYNIIVEDEPTKLFVTIFFHMQYHQQRVRLRDDKIVSLASSLKVEGYERGPFSASAVKQFLTRVAQLRQDLEEKAAREKVREMVINFIMFMGLTAITLPVYAMFFVYILELHVP